MLQFPTNVYPHNVAVEINKSQPFCSTYTFNGDLLRWGLCDYYDNVTGEKVVSAYFPRGGSINTYYNGDTVTLNNKYIIDHFKNGYDYKYFYTLFQSDPTDTSNNDDSDGGLYNIFLLESYFWANATTETKDGKSYQVVWVDGELANIKPAYYYTYADGTKKLVGGCYVEIGHERRFIEYVSTGYTTRNNESVSALKLYLASSFSTTPKSGNRFRIFCNYVISPCYFFKARKDPVISNMTVSLSTNPMSIYCNAKYQQANSVTMKYHRWYLYKCNHHEKITNGSGYVRDLENEYNNATTTEEQDTLSGLMSSLNNKTLAIATGLGDIVGKLIVLSSSVSEAIQYSATIKTYDVDTGLITLRTSLPINPIATTTNNPDDANETNISYEIVESSQQLVGDSGAIYDYDMPYTFYEYPFAKNEAGNDVRFRVRLEVCTQDGKVVYKDVYKIFNANSSSSIKITEITNLNDTSTPVVDTTKRAIHLKWNTKYCSGSSYSVFRKRVDKTETETSLIYYGYSAECYDYSVGNNKQYKYYIVPYKNSTIGTIFETDTITTSWCGWSITSLKAGTSEKYGKPSYGIGGDETWVLSYENQSGSITHNQSRNTHIGVNSYPRISVSGTSYISGSFSAMLGNYSFSSFAFDDTIAKVERWQDFITQDTPFLLKSAKGDVWVVNISSEPTTDYDDSLGGIPSTISFDFIECEKINNITII